MSRLSTRTLRPLVATVAALAAAACADSSSLTSPAGAPGVSATRSPELNTTRHLFHTKDFYANAAKSGSRPRSSGTGISYHGGTVLQNGTKVVAIYWGSSTYPVNYANMPSGNGAGSGDNTLIGAFLRNLSSLKDAAAGKTYFNINATYYGQTNAYITPSVTYTAYWNTAGSGAPNPSASPTDADMIALVNWGINNGKIAYDANTVYAIFTGNGVNLGGGFGSQYCAYHTHGTATSNNQTFFYAAMPYNQQYPSGCTSGYASPNSDVAANSEVNTLAHEIEETTTDDMGNAWYDSRGYENADKCAWTWGTTATANGGTYNLSGGGFYFLVQQNWVNAGSGGCATGY